MNERLRSAFNDHQPELRVLFTILNLANEDLLEGEEGDPDNPVRALTQAEALAVNNVPLSDLKSAVALKWLTHELINKEYEYALTKTGLVALVNAVALRQQQASRHLEDISRLIIRF